MASAQCRRGVPDELPPVVDGPIEIELLAQLDLPLAEDRLGGEDQDPLRPSREPGLTQQHAGLDGLAEPDLVGDEELGRPPLVEPFERAHLMGPRSHRGGRFADAGPARLQAGRLPDEAPDQAPAVDSGRGVRRARGRWRRLQRRTGPRRPIPGSIGLPRSRRPETGGYIVRHEAHQVPAGCLRHVEHDHAGGAIGPQAREAPLLAVHPLGLRAPARVDADALPVALPAGGGLVEAAGPGEPVAGAVFDDAGLLVEDGAVMDGPALGVAGHRDLHVEMAAGDHPRQQLQGIGRLRIGRCERQGGEVLLDPRAERLAPLDGLDLGRVEGAPDDQPHAATVAHQPLDAARGQREGAGVEVARQPVVALGILQRGDVEALDEIAVLGGVLEAPGMVGEHERRSSLQAPAVPLKPAWDSPWTGPHGSVDSDDVSRSCHSLSCSGSSISSRQARRERL